MNLIMIRTDVYTNGTNTLEVSIDRYSNRSETWLFYIGKKEYFYQKPTYARARLEKLGYKYVDTIRSKCF